MLFEIILAIALGALSWTFLEYVLHRFLGHIKTRLLVRTRFHKEHTKHHLKRHYFAGTRDKLLTLLGTAPVVFLFGYLMAGTLMALCFTMGFVSMYLTYELVHFRMHVKSPPHFYASRMRAHHFYHHFVDENMNHGVTTPLWDVVFGTYRRPGTITFPEKFRLSWIEVNHEGNYQDNWGQCYSMIRGSRG